MIVGDAEMADPKVMVFYPCGLLPEQQSGEFEGHSADHTSFLAASNTTLFLLLLLCCSWPFFNSTQMFCAVLTPCSGEIVAVKKFGQHMFVVVHVS